MSKRPRRLASVQASKKLKTCLLELSQDENASQDSMLNWSTLSGYGKGLTVEASTIPQAGNGLFAARNFPEGGVITEYSGRVFPSCKGFGPVYDHSYVAYMPPYCIDGYNMQELGIISKKLNNTSTYIPLGPIANDAKSRTMYNAVTYMSKSNLNPCITNTEIPSTWNMGKRTQRRLWLVATRDIREGEEIFWNYNTDYWNWHDDTENKPKRRR